MKRWNTRVKQNLTLYTEGKGQPPVLNSERLAVVGSTLLLLQRSNNAADRHKLEKQRRLDEAKRKLEDIDNRSEGERNVRIRIDEDDDAEGEDMDD